MQEVLATIDTGASRRYPEIAAENRQKFLESVAKTIPALREHALELLKVQAAA